MQNDLYRKEMAVIVIEDVGSVSDEDSVDKTVGMLSSRYVPDGWLEWVKKHFPHHVIKTKAGYKFWEWVSLIKII